MTTSDPDDLPPELLAGYADDELGPNDRARVEQWLADHPEAHEEVEGQESLGPRNVEFWQAVQPPAPARREWDATLRGIRRRANTSARRPWLPWAGWFTLAAATAAAVLSFLPGPAAGPGADRRPDVAGSLEPDDTPFAMASADDVRIISLPESAAHLLVVGEHPLKDALVRLARADEIEFLGVSTDLDGRFPEMPVEVAPDDSPMIWAPKEP
jgi:anti-sigma factor RsiW